MLGFSLEERLKSLELANRLKAFNNIINMKIIQVACWHHEQANNS